MNEVILKLILIRNLLVILFKRDFNFFFFLLSTQNNSQVKQNFLFLVLN